MGTTTLLVLENLLSEAIGDRFEFDTTTNITTGTTALLISNTLKTWDYGRGDIFNKRYFYITEGNNAGVQRIAKDYLTSAATVKFYGNAFTTNESSAVTVTMHRYNRDNKIRAIKRSLEQLYPLLYKSLDDTTLIAGNILPNPHFDWWTDATTLKFYTTSNTTLARTSTAAYIRGGVYSVKSTAGAANGNFYISSNTYPRLLDLMGRTVSIYVWAYPQTANDSTIIIDTVSNDGSTTQTLTSTTSCPAGYWTLIKFENQALNDDLQEVKITFNVATNGQYCYFDDPMLVGYNRYDIMLPEEFQTDAHISQVKIQESSYSDEIAYDLKPKYWGNPEQFRVKEEIINGTAYKFLHLKDMPLSRSRIWLRGYKKLEIPTTDSGTISLDGMRLNLIIAYAAHLLYEMEKGTVSASDRDTYEQESKYWFSKYRELAPSLMMPMMPDTIWTG